MSAETPTPRTDAEAETYDGDRYTKGMVPADFARQLERDLLAANQREARLREIADRLSEGVRALTECTQTGHPGEPCERTGWIAAQQMDEYREALKDYAAIRSAATGGVEKT